MFGCLIHEEPGLRPLVWRNSGQDAFEPKPATQREMLDCLCSVGNELENLSLIRGDGKSQHGLEPFECESRLRHGPLHLCPAHCGPHG